MIARFFVYGVSPEVKIDLESNVICLKLINGFNTVVIIEKNMCAKWSFGAWYKLLASYRQYCVPFCDKMYNIESFKIYYI